MVLAPNIPQPKTSFYKLIDKKNNRQFTFAIDLYDIPYYYSTIALKQCDYVFKRSFSQYYNSRLPEKYRKKVYPLGITFKLRRPNSLKSTIVEFGSIILNISQNFKIDSQTFNRLSNIIRRHKLEYKGLKNTPSLKDFDQFNFLTQNKIFYQKRFSL